MKQVKALLVAFLILLGSVLVQLPLFLATSNPNIPTLFRLLILLGTSLFLIALLMGLYFILWPEKAREDRKNIWKDIKANVWKISLWTSLVLIAELSLGLLLTAIFQAKPNQASNEFLGQLLFSKDFLVMIFATYFLAPIMEELLFRGIFQEYLHDHFPEMPLLCISFNAWLFAFAHTYTFLSIETLLFMFPSLLFTYIYWKKRKVILTIYSHMLTNILITCLYLIFQFLHIN